MLSRRQKQMLRDAAQAGGYALRSRTDGPNHMAVLLNVSGLPRTDGLPHEQVVGKCGKAHFRMLAEAVTAAWAVEQARAARIGRTEHAA